MKTRRNLTPTTSVISLGLEEALLMRQEAFCPPEWRVISFSGQYPRGQELGDFWTYAEARAYAERSPCDPGETIVVINGDGGELAYTRPFTKEDEENWAWRKRVQSSPWYWGWNRYSFGEHGSYAWLGGYQDHSGLVCEALRLAEAA